MLCRKTILLLLILIPAISSAQVNLNLGLVAYYPFNANANDASGNNINGTVSNATLTTDRAGSPNSAYYFNGSDAYIQLPFSSLYDFAPQDSFSISVWVLPDQGYSWPAQAVVVKSPPHPDYTLSLWNYGTYIYNYQGMSGFAYNNNVIGTTTFTSTQCWYNITTTYKNGVWKLYVNGVLEASDLSQTKFILQDGISKIAFGKKGESFGDWYKGKMDEVRIYNRTLTQDEISLLSQSPCIQAPCNNWLYTSSVPSYVTTGDADVVGTQLTVEVNFNRTFPANSTGGYGFLVSKHTGPGNINYSIWPNGCAISTVNGDVFAMENCPIELNKTYHVAMVYDGSTLKFYRNGFLHSQTPASGNLINNDLQTTIAQNSGVGYPEINQFLGNINEVRIWNVARTQGEIKAYLNSSLPTPPLQTGLIAYYTFDDLLNKQGNPAFNGTLAGAAAINMTNPNCNFVTDSCPLPPVTDTIIINTYTPVLSLDPCENKINVEDAGTFNTGDTVLVIQMKGAIIDSTNTAAFGTITDYKNAGNYEFNYVKSKTGNIIELKNKLTRSYDIPTGKVQLVRVPYYTNATISSVLTCLPWDGNKGGVVVLNVADTINLQADIDVSGKGFKGAIGFNPQNTTTNCFQNNYNYPITSNALAAQKGESIASISQDIICGKGSPAGGGGGGLGHNSGGGGGANGSVGGFGGYQLEPCGNSPYDNRGIGGHALTYSTVTNKIYMGGGGGAGQADNAGNLPSGGGNGAGIIILRSNYLKSNFRKIRANGADGEACTEPPSSDCHDGMGGGGAGGAILISVTQLLDNSIAEDKGGKGADMIGSVPLGGRIGSGGGGGGGVVFLKNNSLQVNLSNVNTGGPNGVLTQDGNSSWGATPGQDGITLFNLVLPFDSLPFTPNIDSVRIKDSLISCSGFDFNGFGYTNTNPVSNWHWDFGDGTTANAQNTNHVYSTNGTFPVKLTITDINGCIDSISKDVISSSFVMDAGPADTICASASAVLQANTTGATLFAWTPAAWLNDSTLLNPTATPPTTTTFYLTAMNALGCSKTDSVVINIRSANSFSVNPPVSICMNDSVMLLATGGDQYSWTPGNLNLPDPIVFPSITTDYSVLITDTVCGNTTTLSTRVTILPLPVIHAAKSNDIDCSIPQSQLSASGATQYSWSPATTLTNPNSAGPVATPDTTTLYTVNGTDLAGCASYDTITVKVGLTNKGGYLMATAFTPNNDGLNDCYGIKYWGAIQQLDFSIYNRWGQRIFHTTNASDCWDGKYKGIPQNPDVFVYMVRAKTFCQNSVFRKGTFALIR